MFWPLCQVSKKHEGLLSITHVTDPTCNEIINNLCQKRVSCQCEIQMCGKGRSREIICECKKILHSF